MAIKKIGGRTRTPSKSTPRERTAALRAELTRYFMNNQTTADHFWKTTNPSLGGKSPASLAKASKLRVVEEYVAFLRKHLRSVKPQFSSKPEDYSVLTIEGTKDEVLGKLKGIPAGQGVIAISFKDAESYYTYAPVYRQILTLLPEIISRQRNRQEFLLARLLFSLTAELPIAAPRLVSMKQVAQREAVRRLAASGGTMPDLPDIPRRRATKMTADMLH
jgi:hypothetical protein